MPTFEAPGGAQLYFEDAGEGLPVLALAGLTRSGRDFDYVAPHLQDCRMIRLDYRGRGKSEWTGAETYTIPNEAADAIALLDHLGLDKVAILGTSRGGLIAMALAAMAKKRLSGVFLNDIGPELSPTGLDAIVDYIGKNPVEKTFEDAAMVRSASFPMVRNLPHGRWLEDMQRFYRQTKDGLEINYDPALRDAVLAANSGPIPDLWPLFKALDGLPLALVRGEHSDLLSQETALKMAKHRPDMIFALVPDRAHVPYLDEPESLVVLKAWLESMT
ncbi:MAG: alpha/beta fold hydrolase [Boseongicola sp.]|nr:MAG: alpha/beta fold hydrolase [Boseongicola sp.]